MSSDGSVTGWMRQMKDGDQPAAAKVWQRYFRRLMALVRKRLGGYHLRGADEEDVALSAFASFWNGLHNDRFTNLRNRDELWKLLVVIAARKSCDAITASNRKKRGGGKVVGESGIPGASNIEQLISMAPTPEFEVASEECLNLLLDKLGDDGFKVVAVMKLDGWLNEEIAQELGCSLRTVERRLKAIRMNWSKELESENDER